MTHRVNAIYLRTAIDQLRGSKASEHFGRVFLILKRLGMTTAQAVMVTTTDDNAKGALSDLLEVYGLKEEELVRGTTTNTRQAYYDPFTNAALKEDYQRSGLQTLIKKWLQGNEKRAQITQTWLTITQTKVGQTKPLRIQMLPTYVEYLGQGELGLAESAQSQVHIPMKAFMAWYFRYTQLDPDPAYPDIRQRLLQEMHIGEAEAALLFDEEDKDLSDVFEEGAVDKEDVLKVVLAAYGSTAAQPQTTRPPVHDERKRIRDLFVTPQMLSDPFYREWTNEDIENVIKRDLNVILVGPPGTGKTHRAVDIATKLALSPDSLEHIQFHESYSYEDFVEAIVPKPVGSAVTFESKSRVFRNLVNKALDSPHETFAIVLDEINRASVAKVFGEAFSLIDRNWRLKFEDNEWVGKRVKLPYSSEEFGIPDNLYLIATMNDVDRSTFDLDYAFMRRFSILRLEPSPSYLRAHLQGADAEPEAVEAAVILLSRLQSIFPVGHVYMEGVKTLDDLRETYGSQIRPAIKSFVGDRGREKLQEADSIVLSLLIPRDED